MKGNCFRLVFQPSMKTNNGFDPMTETEEEDCFVSFTISDKGLYSNLSESISADGDNYEQQ